MILVVKFATGILITSFDLQNKRHTFLEVDSFINITLKQTFCLPKYTNIISSFSTLHIQPFRYIQIYLQ